MAAVKYSALANPTVIMTAMVYGFLLRLAIAASLAGLLLRILITLSLFRYGYAVLRHVANGWNQFPPPDIESTNPFGQFTVVVHAVLFGTLLHLLATTSSSSWAPPSFPITPTCREISCPRAPSSSR
jgi:hypothetical protein